jgi:hypothetical protein
MFPCFNPDMLSENGALRPGSKAPVNPADEIDTEGKYGD